MDFRPVSLVVGATVAVAWLLPACKTANSGAKSIPIENIDSLTLEQWTDACQKELSNPATGADSRKELLQLANTADCAAAYPVIKQIVDQTTQKKT